MAQITTGIRKLLSYPAVYELLQTCLGGKNCRQQYIAEYIRPKAHDTILDIGCGPADILSYLPNTIQYVGLDLSNQYIEHAKKKFAGRGQFICLDANQYIINKQEKFDIILANGLLHHLDNHEVINLFNIAATGLKKSGRMITLDCCYIANQPKIAKFIISQDRGRNVRSPEGYKALAQQVFSQVKTSIRTNLLRVPYTHTIMECTNAQPAVSLPPT